MHRIIKEFLVAFGLGLASNANPCVLPLYPGYISYLSNQTKGKKVNTFLLGSLVLAGVLLFMLLIGAITATLGVSINKFVGFISPIAFGIMFVLGAMLALGMKLKIPTLAKQPQIKNPYLSAFFFGLLYGPIVIPCNAPLVLAVFAFATGIPSFFTLFFTFIFFGLGMGLPLFVISWMYRGGEFVKYITKYESQMRRVVGVLLMLLAVYELVFVFAIFG